MPEPQNEIDALLKIVREVHENLPFNRLPGLKVANLKPDEAGFTFAMRNELIGNSDFIPICNYVDFMAVRKIRRKWKRFEHSLVKDYSQNRVLQQVLRKRKTIR
jgi:hypothetical protein